MLPLPGMIILLATHAAYINMAIHDPEATILSYISEFLNPEQCHELCLTITILPKDAKPPYAEKDSFSMSQCQDISNVEQCKESLHHWLKMQRGEVDWDRLARALRQIGRPDISWELKDRLTKNRSLEPYWTPEENQAKEGPKPAQHIEEKVPFRRTRQKPIQKYQRTSLKEEGCGSIAFFPTWFSLSLHNLPKYIGPAIQLLIASLLTAMSLWVISFCYVMIRNLRWCFFADGTLAQNRINLNRTWNHNMDEQDTQDTDSSEEEEWEETRMAFIH